MKALLFLVTVFMALAGKGQERTPGVFFLSISPMVDQSEKTNRLIIEALRAFLNTKNTSLSENRYWLPSDFQIYRYPYFDIYDIEASNYGTEFYQPTLVDVLATDKPHQRTVKIAFIGHRAGSGENQLKALYNLVARVEGDSVLFSRYLDHATAAWKTVVRNSFTYRISPRKGANETEMADQQRDVERICRFLSCDPIRVTYFSCVDPKELFEIKGFDYHPMMYVDKTGGFAEYGNLIFSGNNSDIYTHELVHIYTAALFPKADAFLDEGFATYFAGSGKFTYAWHRAKFEKFLNMHTGYPIAKHTDPYERNFFEGETSVPYVTAALIMERTMRVYGKGKVLELLKSESDLWTTLGTVGLTKENIDEELLKQVKLPLTAPQ